MKYLEIVAVVFTGCCGEPSSNVPYSVRLRDPYTLLLYAFRLGLESSDSPPDW